MFKKPTILLGIFLYLLIAKPTYSASDVKINEFSPHSSSGNKEWVEFYNLENVDISNYYLDDDLDFDSDTGSSAKKSLSGYDNSSAPYPTIEFSSFLNNGGDYVVLFSPDGTIVDQYQYIEDPGPDVSIGRSPDNSGEFVILASPSKGLANSAPQPSPQPSTIEPTGEVDQGNDYSQKSSTNQNTSANTTPKSFSNTASKIPVPKAVLGETSTASSEPLNLDITSAISPSPSPSASAEITTQSKTAGIVIAVGAILTVISIAGLLWYKWEVKKPEDRTDL